MELRGIHVHADALLSALKEELNREPTADEYEAWRDYVQSDIPEWLRDNIRAYRETDAYRKASGQEVG